MHNRILKVIFFWLKRIYSTKLIAAANYLLNAVVKLIIMNNPELTNLQNEDIVHYSLPFVTPHNSLYKSSCEHNTKQNNTTQQQQQQNKTENVKGKQRLNTFTSFHTSL